MFGDVVEVIVVATDVVALVSEIVASGDKTLSLRFLHGSPDPLSALSAETRLRLSEEIGSGSYSEVEKGNHTFSIFILPII